MGSATETKLEPRRHREFLVTVFSKKPKGRNSPSKDILWSDVWHSEAPLPISHPFQWVLNASEDTVQVRNLGAQGATVVPEALTEIPVSELDERGLIELSDENSKTGYWILVQPVHELRELAKQEWVPNLITVPSVSEAASIAFFKRTSISVSVVMFLFLMVSFLLPKAEPEEGELIPEEFAKVLLSPAFKNMQSPPTESAASGPSASNIVQAFQSKAIKKKTKSLFSAKSANRLLEGSTIFNAAKSSKKARKIFDVNSAISRVNKDRLAVGSKSVGMVGSKGNYKGGKARVEGQGTGLISLPTTGQISQGLTKDQVGKVIRAHMADVRYCYESSLIRDSTLEGKLVVAFTVKPNGRVGKAGVKQSSSDRALDQCIIKKLLKWKFPKPKGGVNVDISYPFIFKVLGG